VGNIYQRFSAPGPDGCGTVDNVIELGDSLFLDKLTFTVNAS